MTKLAVFFVLIIPAVVFGQAGSKSPRQAITTLLDKQTKAWNNGNINEFMDGYWKSDSLLFIGSEIASGWNSTLERYKKTYPDKSAMGTLRFEILKLNQISGDAVLLTGKFFLTRKNDHPHGIFTLLFRKINGRWLIVYDHTAQVKE